MIAVIEQEPTTALSLAAMCRALQVNRAAYYRAHQQARSRDDSELRDAIQRDLVAWIIPKNVLSLVLSTLGVV